jgi:xanthine dehydrogenase accessory factor
MNTEGWDIVEQAADLSRRGEEFALATVVWRQAPSSGQIGSRAIITAAGQLYGWIGGACAEPVVLREAARVIESREPRLLFLGTTDAPMSGLPEGMLYVPMSCQSEGALQIYVEPVVPALDLVVVGGSPMTTTLADLARTLGWKARVIEAAELSSADLTERSIVVIATQGHGDEEAVATSVNAAPLFVGLVASRKRGETVLAYLAERGVPQHLLDRVSTPVGLDLGRTSHQEIAVAVLAELVQRRAAGELTVRSTTSGAATPVAASSVVERAVETIDPVCGMTVDVSPKNHPVDHDGTTYYFCCVRCSDSFAADPQRYLAEAEA